MADDSGRLTTPPEGRALEPPGSARDVGTVARGGAVQIAGQISQRSVLFFFTVLAGRVLGIAGLGLYRQISQALAIAGQFSLAGFNYGAMRFITKARAERDHGGVKGAARVALGGTAVASGITVVALLVLAGPLSVAFSDEADRIGDAAFLAYLLRLGVLYAPCFAFMQTLRYCTQAYRTMVPSVIVGNIIQPVVRFVLGAGVLGVGYLIAAQVPSMLSWTIVSLTASMAVGAAAGLYYFRRILTVEERSATPHASAGAMVRFSLPQAGASLLGIQALGLGVIVLGVLSTDRETGLFAVALALQGPAGVFLSGMVNIWAPVVSDLHSRGAIDRLGSLYKTITRWTVTFSFPILAATMIAADLFVRVFTSKGDDAVPVVMLLAAGNVFYTGTGPSGYVLSMTGRPGINFVNSAIGVALYALGGLWLVPQYGAVGMAAVDAVVTAVINLARIVEVRMLVGIQPFGRSFLKPVAATLVGAVVLIGWRVEFPDSVVIEIAGILVATAVYLGVLRLFGIDPEERYVWERVRERVARLRRR